MKKFYVTRTKGRVEVSDRVGGNDNFTALETTSGEFIFGPLAVGVTEPFLVSTPAEAAEAAKVPVQQMYNWSMAGLKQLTEAGPDGLAMYTAELVTRKLQAFSVHCHFWGAPKVYVPVRGDNGPVAANPPAEIFQAEAYILALLSEPRSIEDISRICNLTKVCEAPADSLQDNP